MCAGCIAFVLVVAALVKEIELLLNGFGGREQRAACTRLALQLQEIAATTLPSAEAKLSVLWPELPRLPVPTAKKLRVTKGTSFTQWDSPEASADSSSDDDDSNSSSSSKSTIERAEHLARTIISTGIGGRCSSRAACDVVEDLLVDALFTGATTLQEVRARNAALGHKNGKHTVFMDTGRSSTDDSRCLPGIVISRQVQLSDPIDNSGSGTAHVVFFQCDFANIVQTGAKNTTVFGGHAGVAALASYREQWIRRTLLWLGTAGVRLLVCSEVLDDTTLHMCSSFGIAVCHAVPLPEIQWSCNVLDVFPFTDITPTDLLLPLVPSSGIAPITSYHGLTIGDQVSALIIPAGAAEGSADGKRKLIRSLTLAAPDRELCQEMASCARDGIKLLRNWLGACEESATTPNTAPSVSLQQTSPHGAAAAAATTAVLVPGGGAFEVAFSSLLSSKLNSKASSSRHGIATDAALGMLSRALLRIPAQLYWVAHPGNIRGWYLTVLPELMRRHDQGQRAWGIQPSNGTIAATAAALQEDEIACVELLSGKMLLAECCAQLLASLLKVDATVHTKTLLRPKEDLLQSADNNT